jgi:hypothetical protein
MHLRFRLPMCPVIVVHAGGHRTQMALNNPEEKTQPKKYCWVASFALCEVPNI